MWGADTVVSELEHPTGVAMDGDDALYVLEFSANAIKRVTLGTAPSQFIANFVQVTGTAGGVASGGALDFPIYCTLGDGTLYVSNWGERNEREGISSFAAPYIYGEDALDSQDEAGSYNEYYFGTQPRDPNNHYVVGPRGLAYRAGLLYVWEDEYNFFGARAIPALTTWTGTAKAYYVIGFSGSAFNPPADVFAHMQGLRLSADGLYLCYSGSHHTFKRLSLSSGVEENMIGDASYGVASSDNGWYYTVRQDGICKRWHPTYGTEDVILSSVDARSMFDIDARADGTLLASSSATPDIGAGGELSIFEAQDGGRNSILHIRPQPPGDPTDVDGDIGPSIAIANVRHTAVHDSEFGVASIFVPRTNHQLTQVNADPGGTFAIPGAPASFIDVALLENAPAIGGGSG